MNKNDQNILLKRLIISSIVVVAAFMFYVAFFLHARISVEITPENAVVTIDNKPMEVKNGKSSFSATLGKHTIKIEADNYIGYKEDIDLKRGRNYSKKISLNKAPEPTEITSNASGLAIKDNWIYYQSSNDKLIYRATLTKKENGTVEIKENQPITSNPISNVDKIIWGPNKELLLLKRGGTINLFDFKKYDFVHQKETLFGQDIGDIAWSPDDSRIAYYYAPSSGERSIIFANKTNDIKYRVVNLAELGIFDPYIAFSPNSEWLLMIPRNKNYQENHIYLINVFTKSITKLDDTGDQKEAIFSADSQKIIYSTYSTDRNNPYKQKLSIMNLDGGDKKSLKLAGRASDIKYWSDPNKIFLPRSDDSSKLVLYDIENGDVVDFYFKGQGNSDISEIVLSEDKNSAIFISRDKLFYIKLEGNG